MTVPISESAEDGLVKRARNAFSRGDYKLAMNIYQQAGNQYGSSLFDVNIQICERRMRKRDDVVVSAVPENPISKQLAETQALLELYYRRCQKLEHCQLDGG